MKKIAKITGLVLISLLLLVAIAGFVDYSRMANKADDRYAQLGQEAKIIDEGGSGFRDLNKNGKLDVYEDSRATIDARLDDLISQMSLEEKAGTMFITMIGMTKRNADRI